MKLKQKKVSNFLLTHLHYRFYTCKFSNFRSRSIKFKDRMVVTFFLKREKYFILKNQNLI